MEDLGTLTVTANRSGTWASDCDSPHRGGSYARFYTFTLTPDNFYMTQKGEVTIDLQSTHDTLLYLMQGDGKNGAVITSNNDAEIGTTNSRITHTLDAGTYTIEATTLRAGQAGRFDLRVTWPHVPAGQELALRALYKATGGANWINNTNWKSDEHVREWYGVTTNRQGLVISLNLSENGLTGELPAELDWYALRHLEWLNLRVNQLSGEILAELDELSNLTFLSLSKNQLTGTIPEELGNHHLTWLYLYDNQLTGTVPEELGDLVSLRTLDLENNQLKWGIPPELGKLSDLTRLYLYGNQLSGTIPPTLGKLSDLTRLYLYDNQLTGGIPTELGNLRYLETLNLSHNQLTGSIPKELGNLDHLFTLALNNNNLTGPIPAELGWLPGACDVSFFGVICRLTNSTFLDLHLQGNQLSGEIPKELGNIGYLRTMKTKPGNARLTGCVVPNVVLDTLRVGLHLLTKWAIANVKKGTKFGFYPSQRLYQ